jgi:hypothetical protein
MVGSPWILSWETFGTASVFMTIDLRDAETGEVVGPHLVVDVVFAPTFQTILVHGHVGTYYLGVNGPTLSDGGWRVTVFDAPRS